MGEEGQGSEPRWVFRYMKETKEGFLLSTGRSFYAHSSLLSVDSDGDNLTYGFDGGVDEFDDEPLTSEERVEIADYMIARWNLFREK